MVLPWDSISYIYIYTNIYILLRRSWKLIFICLLANSSQIRPHYVHTHKCSLGRDLGPSCSSRHEDDRSILVDEQRWIHGRHGNLSRYDVVAGRCRDSEIIARSRCGKVVHFIVEYNSGSWSSTFGPETTWIKNSRSMYYQHTQVSTWSNLKDTDPFQAWALWIHTHYIAYRITLPPYPQQYTDYRNAQAPPKRHSTIRSFSAPHQFKLLKLDIDMMLNNKMLGGIARFLFAAYQIQLAHSCADQLFLQQFVLAVLISIELTKAKILSFIYE